MGARTPWQTLAETKKDHTIQDKIDHIIVAMLENRSLDNVLGWLYADKGNRPAHNIPQQSSPTYDGLVLNKYWNTAPPNDPHAPKIYAARGVTTYPDKTPYPDPGEVCPYMYQQMFGTENPSINQSADMSGFLQNYKQRVKQEKGIKPEQIMECYTPDQLPVLNNLALNFAVSDRWFGSLPCETFPNRAFVHAGSSFGRLNNCDGRYNDGYDFDFSAYSNQTTIFGVLYNLGYSWKIYGPCAGQNAPFTATTHQFSGTLTSQPLMGYTDSLDHFEYDASRGQLPTYAFVEPDFYGDPTSDQHPADACSMARGEQFIRRIWKAVSTSPQWKSTILIFTYDEHGGCYDHVPPPRTATPPDASQPQFPMPINPFTQYGTRIPAVVISPYVEAGTVFRSPSASVEFDHTSILVTLRDWIFPDQQPTEWLGERVKRAPTIWPVLTRTEPRDDIPDIPPAKRVPLHRGPSRLSSLQKGLMVKALTQRRFELERARLGPAATAAEYSAINKEVLDKFQEVETVNDAKSLFEAP
jgi:phospholipase C